MVPAAFASDDRRRTRLADFVRRAERERDGAERARLLYVATTRARERLHLVWQLPTRMRRPRRRARCSHTCGPSSPPRRATQRRTRDARHYSASRSCPCCAGSSRPWRTLDDGRQRSDGSGAAPGVRVGGPGRRARRHRRPSLLAAHRGAGARALERATRRRRRSRRSRASSSCSASKPRERDSAAERVVAALSRALADPHGQWVLGPHERSALRAQADAARRRRARARSARPNVRRRGPALDRRLQDERASKAAISRHFSTPRSSATRRSSSATRAPSRRPTRAPCSLACTFRCSASFASWPAAATASRSS